MATLRQQPDGFRFADQPGTSPFLDTRAFIGTSPTGTKLLRYGQGRRSLPLHGASNQFSDVQNLLPCMAGLLLRNGRRSNPKMKVKAVIGARNFHDLYLVDSVLHRIGSSRSYNLDSEAEGEF